MRSMMKGRFSLLAGATLAVTLGTLTLAALHELCATGHHA